MPFHFCGTGIRWDVDTFQLGEYCLSKIGGTRSELDEIITQASREMGHALLSVANSGRGIFGDAGIVIESNNEAM
jgi:hypothetical protein